MKVYVVTEEEEFENGSAETFLAVCATELDALAAIEAAGGSTIETRAVAVRYSIGKARWSSEVDPTAITLEHEYQAYRWTGGVDRSRRHLHEERVRVPDGTRWSAQQTWHVREVEIAGFDREVALEAIKQYDIARGWRAPFNPDAVSNRDEGVVTT